MQPDNVPEERCRRSAGFPAFRDGWLRKAAAVGVMSAMSVGAYTLPASAAVDNHPEEEAESSASIVDSNVLDTGIAGGGRSEATWESDPGPNSEALNVDALGSELVQLGDVEVPLDDFIDFGQMGALQSESETTGPQDARAASGVAGGDGSVHLDGDDADFGAAEIDLLSLLETSGADGITDLLVDEASLYLGAGGAEVIAEDGEFLDPDGVGGLGQYRAGEASIVMQSPAVEEAAGLIYDAIGQLDAEAEDQVNELLDLTDIIDDLPGDASLDVEVTSDMQEEIFAAVLDEPITTANEVLSIDFSTGTVELHLDQLLSGENRPDQPTGMNNQNPNTELIDDELYPMIAENVHDLMEEVTTIVVGSVEGAMGSITLDFTVGIDETEASWGVNLMDEEVRPVECEGDEITCTTLTTAIDTVVAPLVDTALIPARDFLVSDAGAEVFETLIQDIKTTSVTVPIREALEPFIEMAAEVLSVQLNRQVEETCELPDGTEVTESLEVSAISVGFLQAADGARLDLGKAGARIDACEDSEDEDDEDSELDVTVEPSEVEPGDSTEVDGSGFTPEDTVTIELVDSEGNPVGDPEEATTDEDGNFTVDFPVPEGTDPGDFTVVVTDEPTGEQSETPLTVATPPEDGEDDPEDEDPGDGSEEPGLSIVPDTVEPGDTVTVEGEDFAPGSTVTIEITDDEGEVIDTVEGVEVDDDGNLVIEWTVPEDVDPGVLVIDVTDEEDPDTNATDVVNVVDGDAEDLPTVSVQPETLPAGDEVTIEGETFVPDSTVTIEVTDTDGEVVDTIEDTQVTEDGTLSTTWTVPEETDPGALIVTITDDEDPEVTASGTFEVIDGDSVTIDPTLGADPETLQPGEELTLNGSGYFPGRTVTIEITDTDGEVVDTIEDVEVEGQGTFTVTWTVPEGVEPGGLLVTATDDEEPEHTDSVTVTVTDGSADEAPGLSVEPEVVAPGEEATVSGENFAPGASVTVEITDLDGEVIDTIEGVEVEDDGTLSFTWTAPSEMERELVVITATDVENSDDSATVLLKVKDDAAQGELSIGIERSQVAQGTEQVGYASGYAPGTEVTGVMNSSPTVELGTEVADENGTVTFTWEVPEDAELGTHTFSVAAEGIDDQSISFQVVSDSEAPGTDDGSAGSGSEGPAGAAGGGGQASGPSDDLADTGASGYGSLIGLAVLAMVAGAGALILAKRRNASAE